MSTKIYQKLSNLAVAVRNCQESDLNTWAIRHKALGDAICKNYMPSGSGFDCGTTLDWNASDGGKLVFLTAFHHMDDSGGYDGWTDHTITVRASLAFELDIRISGRNRNDVKEYIDQSFDLALRSELADAQLQSLTA